MEMEILVDYSIGAGGSVNVFYQGQNFSIDISEEDAALSGGQYVVPGVYSENLSVSITY